MTMEYIKVVLDGYFNPNTNKNLKNYFYRQFKNAEKEYYEVEEFFEGCLNIIEKFEENLNYQLSKRKNELYIIRDLAKARKTKYSENDMLGLTYDQRLKKSIEYAEEELSSISINNFTVNLSSLTRGHYAYNMRNEEVLNIKIEINEAYIKALQENKQKQTTLEPENEVKPIVEPEAGTLIATIDDYLLKFKENKNINDTDYQILTDALKQYFEKGTFPILNKVIKVTGLNKKKLGWALKELYSFRKSGNLSVEYLRFAKHYISTFKDTAFDENNYLKSNLYKYFTTKTQ